MTTDRELLELAAKAAGIDGIYDHDFDMLVLLDSEVVPTMWNPLKDDGDALRLAVKLKIDIEFDDWNGREIVTASQPEIFTGWLEEDSEPDPYASARRAIVRAAAALGKAMK